ncbi:hypothetical protein NEFER03_0125 [Nematocida sp. LUAm3]|nr:hypothetical protein NEFER03_0125 [Nematocida sp. LUAm3]KAI5173578.1 hypothetical protein NEFER02_0094 [Nematocida sp. LUAm2]KAI5176799.1 hypothetical protein NEFER01_0124 [Nematocida sp. LUAm1]
MYEVEADRLEEGYLYRVLGVSKHASTEELRNAYRRAAWEKHPDRAIGKEEEFAEMSQAYTVLSNSKYRLLYNLLGDSVIPIITEQKYSAYVEKIVDIRTISVLVVEIVLLLVSSVFYPYILLLVRFGYITYSSTIIPVVLSFFIGAVLTVFLVGDREVLRVVVVLWALQGVSVIGMCLLVALYLDSLVCWVGLVFGWFGLIYMYTMLMVARAGSYVGKWLSSGFLLSRKCLLSNSYLLFVGYSFLQILVFLVPGGLGRLLRALCLPAYVVVLGILGVIGRSIGVFLFAWSLVILVPILIVQKEEFGWGWRALVLAVLAGKVILIIFGGIGVCGSVERARWVKRWRQEICGVE